MFKAKPLLYARSFNKVKEPESEIYKTATSSGCGVSAITLCLRSAISIIRRDLARLVPTERSSPLVARTDLSTS